MTDAPAPLRRRPRVGALGVGWIGRHRLEVLAAADLVQIVALADASHDSVRQAAAIAPHAAVCDSLEQLLATDLDGLVIATPTAQHASQARAALQAGVAVCCQKPLGRTLHETRTVIDAARAADRLLTVDFSYRYMAATEAVRRAVSTAAIGNLVAAELVFHNAYGPDKPWYRTPALSGGGCVIDLGVHLIDLLTWLTGERVAGVGSAALFAEGRPWTGGDAVEDLAQCHLRLASGASASLTCSWWLPAGCDAVIGVTLYGANGGVRLRNVGGSFYDFLAERLDATRTYVLVEPPDAWGGRAVVEWARRLVDGGRYDAACESHLAVSAVLDAIYDAAGMRTTEAVNCPAAGTAPVPVTPA